MIFFLLYLRLRVSDRYKMAVIATISSTNIKYKSQLIKIALTEEAKKIAKKHRISSIFVCKRVNQY